MSHSIQKVIKGDIIVERVSGKRRMIPVTKVELDACSSKGVHINRNMCYDRNAVVDLVEGEGTLGDVEREFAAMGDLEEDWKVLETAGPNPHLKHVHIPNGMSEEELAELLVKQ